MRVLTIGSGKGGVGRSAITANLGVALAKLGESTLIIDGSITSPSQALFFNLEKVPRTLNDVLLGEITPEEAIYRGAGGVEILPAAVTLEKIRKAKPARLASLIKDHIDGYDFILIDASNGLRKETIAALKAGEELLIVTVPELTAVSDSMKTKVASEFLGLTPIGMVLNQVKGEDYELGEDEIGRIMNLSILSKIPYDRNVRRSINEGKLLLEWKPDSPSSEEIKKLAEKLIEE